MIISGNKNLKMRKVYYSFYLEINSRIYLKKWVEKPDLLLNE